MTTSTKMRSFNLPRVEFPTEKAKPGNLGKEGGLVPTTFELWGTPGHFCPSLAKAPRATTWIWNLHGDAHDFDIQHPWDSAKGKLGKDQLELQDIMRRVFSAHFGHLSLIFLWIGGMHFHGARFSNYSAWLSDPTNILPSSHVVWPVVGQEILNAPLGGGMTGVRVTSGWFNLWRGVGFVNETELYWMAVSSLVMSFLMAFAGWFHYHRFAPRLEWFQSVESMLNHHVGGLLGMGSLSWSGHLVHVALPVNYLLDAGLDPRDVPLPHELLLGGELLSDIYPSFGKGLVPLFTLDWAQYGDILTFKGGLNEVTGSLWLTDIAHHHLAVGALLTLFGSFAHGSPWEARNSTTTGPSLKARLDSLEIPLIGGTHEGVFEILVGSLHAQLALNLAMLGSLSILVSHHMYAMPPYPYIAIDYATELSLFVHHMWIGGFCIVGAGAHASIFMVRDYNPVTLEAPILDEVLGHRDVIVSHLNWVCIFLGFHSFGLYSHNDTMRALGRPGDLFSDSAIALKPVSLLSFHSHSSAIAPGMSGTVSYIFQGSGVELLGGEVAMGPIVFGTADFLVHHIHAFNIHVTALILVKGVLFARSSRLIPDKAIDGGFRFPCDGPGRGGTCQVSGWDHVFLALFWMYNTISIAIFYFDWRMSSGVWGTVGGAGKYSGVLNEYKLSDFSCLEGYAGPEGFGESALTVNGWLRDYLWAFSYSVVGSYGSDASAYGLIFMAGHFVWAFSLMFLFSGRGYWQDLIESILWAHNKLKVGPSISPRALSITQGRAVGVAHYLLGGIGTTWAFLLGKF
jgi:photosystem I P700 chlorophyll a apoprotein A1